MKNRIILRLPMLLLSIFGLTFLASCEKDPITLAMHSPIYPSSGEAVTYSLEKATAGSINSANLFEQVNTINSNGVITTTGSETLLQSWTNPSGDLAFTKSSGHGSNKLITYRWEVSTPESSKNYQVTYATRPYPVADMPAPIYTQGDPDDVFDVVYIPDTDITNLNTFYPNCSGAIRDAFFEEEHTRFWRKQYNFYINPDRGTATDFDRRTIDGPHQPPANIANLAFAEGKVLMHQNNLRDWATGSIFSTEMQNRGTIMHEAGHSLYDLKDEYDRGTHFELDVLPNNWETLAGAQAAGSSGYGNCKSSSDAVEMGSSGWFRLCDANCLMGPTDNINLKRYDCPCNSRIIYTVFDNAIN